MPRAWDRLFAMLNALDSKTSALLRFNAITVAALAYVVVVSGVDPFAQSKPLIKTIGLAVGHISLVLSVASCGFAFPVIGVARGFFDGTPGLDDGVLDRLGRLVAQRTRLYPGPGGSRSRAGWASRPGRAGDHPLTTGAFMADLILDDYAKLAVFREGQGSPSASSSSPGSRCRSRTSCPSPT